MAEIEIPGRSPAAPAGQFTAYLTAHGAWFLAFGLQLVLFPYLVRIVLEESEARFGLAQMSLQLPTTLLILFGGALADRTDPRRVMIVCGALTIAAFLSLGAAVAGGGLTYGLMIAYALSIGALGAFANPARDSLLSRAAPSATPAGIQKAVSMATLVQFGAQIGGMALAAAVPLTGVAPMLFGQAALMAVALAAAMRIAPGAPAARPQTAGVVGRLARDLAEGFVTVGRSSVIGPVMICALGMGVCFMGAFFVLLPLIVESHFAGSEDRAQIATALAVFSLCFWVGSMLSAMALVRLGTPANKGVAYLTALATGSCVLLLCALPAPFWLLCGLNFVWGLGGGVAMTLGRGIVQGHAPPDQRARVLAIFTLATMGGGPIGAVAYGVLAGEIGARTAILIPGGLMLAVVATVALRSRLRELRD